MPPNDLPIDAEVERLGQWLQDQITRARGHREDEERKWKQFDRYYESKPDVDKKDFPWPDASNVFIPITRIHSDLIFSRILASLWTQQDVWIVKSYNKRYKDYVSGIQRLLNWTAKERMQANKTSKPAVKQIVKRGTSIFKLYWRRLVKPVFMVDDAGELQKDTQLFYDAPALDWVRVEDFLIPDPNLTKRDQHIWQAEEIRLTWTQLNELAFNGFFDSNRLEEFKPYLTTHWNQYQSSTEELHGINRVENAIIPIYETYAWLDINNDNLAEPVIIWVERYSGKVLKMAYNDDPLGRSPYLPIQFMPREDWFYGIGVPEMLEHLNREINTMHNQRRDNATIANIRQPIVRTGSDCTLKPGVRMFPGLPIFTEDPARDLSLLQLGDVYPSASSDEILDLQYCERTTGVTDPMVGRLGSGMGTRTPAALGISLMQQSASRMQIGIDDIRETFEEIGYRTLELYGRYKDSAEGIIGKLFDGEPETINKVMEVLSLPVTELREHFVMDMSVVSQTINREVAQQMHQAKIQMKMNIGQQMMQLGQMLINPQMPPEFKKPLGDLAIKLVKDLDKDLVRWQELFDERDPTQYAPMLEEVQQYGMGGGGLPGSVPPGDSEAGIAGALPEPGFGGNGLAGPQPGVGGGGLPGLQGPPARV
jgi:hypothetical protein